MLCSQWIHKMVFLGALALGVPVASAQEPVALPQSATTSMEQLLKRLEETEARIKSLEGELKAVSTSADQLGGAAGATADALPGQAAKPTADDRLKLLEDNYKKDKAAAAAKSAADAKKPTVRVGGRIDLDSYFFPQSTPLINFLESGNVGNDPEALFQFRRARIEAQGNILENMTYKIEVDFATPNNPTMKDLYIGFTELPYNTTVQVGNQKKPLGLENLTSSRFLTFIERATLADGFDEDTRRVGILGYGYTDCEAVGWALGVFGNQGIADSGTDAAPAGTYRGDSFQPSVNARVHTSPWYDETSDGRGYAHFALSGQYADAWEAPVPGAPATVVTQSRFRTRPELRSSNRWVDTGILTNTIDTSLFATEAAINVGSASLVGEYVRSYVNRLGLANTNTFDGYYVYASYFLTGEHRPYNRKRGVFDRIVPHENFFLVDRCCGGTGSGWGAFEVAARFSYIDLADSPAPTTNAAVNGLGGVERNWTVGLNWYLNPYAKIQFNYVRGFIDQRRFSTGQPAGLTSGDFTGLATRLHIDF